MIFKGSRYIKTPVYSRRGQSFIFGVRNKAKFDQNLADYYTFTREDTLDGIAFRYYGNPNLYWAILDANPQYQSEMDINVGDVLMIPSFAEVRALSE